VILAEPPAIFCDAPAAAGAAGADAYARAVKERLAGQTAQAIADLEALLSARPDDVDARLQLGLALRAAGRDAEAESALREVLRQAPDYKDAKVAMAQILAARGDAAGARAILGPDLMATPGDADTADLVARLRTQRPAAASAPAPPWRLDANVAYSTLTRDLPGWWEGDLALSHKVGPDSAATVSFQRIERFRLGETYLEGAFDHGWRGGEWSLAVGGSLNPTFRPRVAVHGEAELNPWTKSPWSLGLAANYSLYVAGGVETLTVGPDRLIFGDRGKLSARFIGTRDEINQTLLGFSAGASWRFTSRFDASASYVDSAETDTGRTMRVRAEAIAGNFSIDDRTILHASVTHEALENSYERVEFAIGATAKF